jgi:hypothetical protein
VDAIEALAGIVDRRVGHHAQKLVAADADDRVVGAHMTADRVHRALQQRVAGSMTMPVVLGLHPDDLDISATPLNC